MADAFVPTTEEGKKALAEGADPAVVKSMEEDGTFTTEPNDELEEGKQHVDKKPGEGEPVVPKPGEDGGDGGARGKKDDDDTQGQPNRKVEHIPAWKAKEMAKKAGEESARETEERIRKEFADQLAAAGNRPGGANDDDVKKIAEEFGLKPELVPAFIERIGGQVAKNLKISGLSDDDRKLLDSVKEREAAQAQDAGFQKEWSDAQTQEALSAISGGKEITAEVQKKVRELAFSSTYNRYRLVDIIRLEGAQLFPKQSKSGESGRGGADRGQALKSIEEMTPTEVMNLSDDDFQRISDEMAKGSSRFTGIKRAPKEKRENKR